MSKQMPSTTIRDERITTTWRVLIAYVLITFVGFNLRSVILAVPPIVPLIQHDLGTSYSVTGLLTALPVLVLGIMAWPLGFLVERWGGRICVSIGLTLLVVGTFLRVFQPKAISLLLFTLILSLGVTLAQTAMPSLIRHWFPTRIGFVAALFGDGLIIGEAVAAGITLPVLAGFLGNDAWPLTFVFWSVPVAVTLILWLWLAPQAAAPRLTTRNRAATPEHPQSVQPVRVNALHLGILLGAGSLVYFGMNSWIASYNQALHAPFMTSVVLATLNIAQLPVSIGVTFFAQRLVGRRAPFIVSGAVCAFALTAWLLTPPTLEPLWAALLGGSSALVFTLGIALPPLLASPEKVARLTGTTISLTYAVAFVGPFLGGSLWDLFHLPAMAFLPVLLACAMLIVLGALLPSRAHFGVGIAPAPARSDTTAPPTTP